MLQRRHLSPGLKDQKWQLLSVVQPAVAPTGSEVAAGELWGCCKTLLGGSIPPWLDMLLVL